MFSSKKNETIVRRELSCEFVCLCRYAAEYGTCHAFHVPHCRITGATVAGKLVNLALSASAERSFSGLRRLNLYIRSTCGQLHLNNIAICHVHKDILDQFDVDKLMMEFILKTDSHRLVFGKV